MAFLLIITFLCPTVGLLIVLLLILANRKKVFPAVAKWLCFPLGLISANFGYSMVPSGETDLTRYFDQINDFSASSIFTIFSWDDKNLYLRDILFYYVYHTGDAHILPYIVSFFIYSIVFYVLFDRVTRSTMKFTVSDVAKIAIISVGIISPYSIIGNIRCVFAFTLISYAVYRDLVQKKRNFFTYILYVIPVGLHISAIVILIFRCLQTIAMYMGRGIIFFAAAIPALIMIAYSYIDFLSSFVFGSIFSNAITLSYVYLTDLGELNHVDEIWEIIGKYYGIVFLLSIVIILYMARFVSDVRNNIREDPFNSPMVAYIYLVLVGALGCLYIVAGAFWRFESIVVLFSVIILIPLLELKSRWINYSIQILFCTVTIPIIGNILQLYAGLNLMQTFINFIGTTGITIIYYLSKGIIQMILL